MQCGTTTGNIVVIEARVVSFLNFSLLPSRKCWNRLKADSQSDDDAYVDTLGWMLLLLAHQIVVELFSAFDVSLQNDHDDSDQAVLCY